MMGRERERETRGRGLGLTHATFGLKVLCSY